MLSRIFSITTQSKQHADKRQIVQLLRWHTLKLQISSQFTNEYVGFGRGRPLCLHDMAFTLRSLFIDWDNYFFYLMNKI